MFKSALLLLSTSVLLALTWPPSCAHAGAWSPAQGHGYGKLWLKHLYGFGYHDQSGDTIDYGTYNEVFLNAYGELGLGHGLAVTLHFPFYKFFSLEDTRSGDMGRHHTVGEPTLGLRYQFLSMGRLASSLELTSRAPIAPSGPQQPFYDKQGNRIGDLRIGEGAWDIMPVYNLGYGWDRVYAQASVGYMVRFNDYDDAVRWTAEVGGNLRNEWDGRARATGHHAVRNGDAARVETPSGIGNGVTYMGFALEVEYQFVPQWWLGLTVEGGLGMLRSQTGGPVTSLYVATSF